MAETSQMRVQFHLGCVNEITVFTGEMALDSMVLFEIVSRGGVEPTASARMMFSHGMIFKIFGSDFA
jgi:hypothetical protein